jgi:hypothetical protein
VFKVGSKIELNLLWLKIFHSFCLVVLTQTICFLKVMGFNKYNNLFFIQC